MARAGEIDHPGADVDADAAGGLQGGEQIAPRAADLEDRGTRGHVETDDLLDTLVIVAVPPLPALVVRRLGVEKADQLGLVHGCRIIHEPGAEW